MRRCVAVLIVLAVAFSTSAGGADNDLPPPLKERWKLKLFPEKLPALGDGLYEKAWIQQLPRSRIGTGLDVALRFVAPAKEKEPAELRLTTTFFPGQGKPPRETTRKVPVQIEGPLMEFDGQVHTAHLDPGKGFVLDAVIRVGDQKWYHLKSEQIGPAKNVRLDEMVFEFKDDPATVAKGRLVVRWHRRDLDRPSEENLVLPSSFRVAPSKTDDRRRLQFVADVVNRVGHNIPEWYFVGKDCALLRTHQASHTGVFKAVP